jgi:hypothetical protein
VLCVDHPQCGIQACVPNSEPNRNEIMGEHFKFCTFYSSEKGIFLAQDQMSALLIQRCDGVHTEIHNKYNESLSNMELRTANFGYRLFWIKYLYSMEYKFIWSFHVTVGKLRSYEGVMFCAQPNADILTDFGCFPLSLQAKVSRHSTLPKNRPWLLLPH